MNAPIRVPAVCELGHFLTHGQCVACVKKSKMKPRKIVPCALHLDEVAPCPRCAIANAANARELESTEPWHRRWRHHVPHTTTPEMVKESRRMFAFPSTYAIKDEDR